jgi:hypothetical protein
MTFKNIGKRRRYFFKDILAKNKIEAYISNGYFVKLEF